MSNVLDKIRNAQQYQAVFSARKNLHSSYYTLYFQKNTLEHPRLGIIASKKNIRLAVERNRIRRIVRETFRQSKIAPNGIDIVIVVKREAKGVNRKELRECLEQLVMRLKG